MQFLEGLSKPEIAEYLAEVRSILEPQLVNRDGVWVADYVRLRFAATKVAPSRNKAKNNK